MEVDRGGVTSIGRNQAWENPTGLSSNPHSAVQHCFAAEVGVGVGAGFFMHQGSLATVLLR